MKIVVKTEIEITQDLVQSIMDGAFYGMTYWADSMTVKDKGDFVEDKDKDYCTSEKYTEILLNNGSLKVTILPGYELSEGQRRTFTLNISKLSKGLKMILEKYDHLLSISNIDDIDSTAGESIIQCALFGDIVYG